MLETTTRYPIIEPRTESEGLIIYGSKETSLDILFGLYEEIKTCFNEESGYPELETTRTRKSWLYET